MSSAVSHLTFLDRGVSKAIECILQKIHGNHDQALTKVRVPAKVTSELDSVHSLQNSSVGRFLLCVSRIEIHWMSPALLVKVKLLLSL